MNVHALNRAKHRSNLFFIRPLMVMLLLLMALTACSLLGGGENLGHETVLQGEATLVCSKACADRGQCGTTPEGQKVILANTFAPAVTGHDVPLPEETAVVILEAREQLLNQVADGQQLVVNFYAVSPPSSGIAWVAGWCVSQ